MGGLIKLRPCPFCGREAKIIKRFEGSDVRTQYQAACVNGKCDVMPFTALHDTQGEAAYFWNWKGEGNELD